MPIVIGGKPESGFGDPVGLLTDCHRRVEMFLSVLKEVSAQRSGGALTAEERAALETALRYFREAAPKHTADEESLFSRLRALGRPELRAVLELVAALEQDHASAESRHAELDGLGRAWLAAGCRPPAEAERFSQIAGRLTELYRNHIAIEERGVCPAAVALLGKADRDALGSEMAARRGRAVT